MNVELVRLDDDLDWLLRPVFAGHIKYESLLDGTLDLYDIALLNHAMDAEQENRYRIQEASRD